MSKTKENARAVSMITPKASFEELRQETERAVLGVLASGDYVLGRETSAFESEICQYLGIGHAVGVSSGTEALLVALQELEVGRGDEVVTTPFTFIATATVIARLGAKPVFADIDPSTFQMDPRRLAEAITPRTKAVIGVHLYGHPAPLQEYLAACKGAKQPALLIEDAAQAIGTVCRVGGRLVKAGTQSAWGCFSFYPTKNLPACGEAGIMVTADAGRAERARQIRNQGQDAPYRHRFLAGNARLDAIQSAILRVRLPRIEEWNGRRRAHAALYRKLFAESSVLSGIEGIRLPPEPAGGEVPNFHQFTVRFPRRDELRTHLSEAGVQSGVYYPIPVPFQPVFASLGHKPGSFPQAEAASREVLSLPVHQHLAAEDVEQVVSTIEDFYRR